MFRSIQILRAVSALAVVLFHAVQRAGGGFTIGAAGVDVFFVISGFIMWSVTDGQPVSPRRFMVHRLIRIVPLYWAVTLAMVALAQAPGLFPHLPTQAGHVMLSLLFIPHLDPDGGAFPLLAVGWTLNDEMLFYAVFAAALRLPRRSRLLAVSGTLLALVASGLSLRPAGALLQSYTDPILLEFVAGMWLAALRQHRLPRPLSRALLVAAVGSLALQAVLPDAGPQWRLLLWGMPALSMVAAGTSLDRPAHAVSWLTRALLALGDASYAIYLLHGLVVSACWRLLHDAPFAVGLAACVVGSAALGQLCFLALERPLTRWLRRRVDPGGSVQLAPALATPS